MKKLLFVLAFTFLSISVFCQMKTVVVYSGQFSSNCNPGERSMVIYNPDGTSTNLCVDGLAEITKEISDIMTLGYKLIHFGSSGAPENAIQVSQGSAVVAQEVFYTQGGIRVKEPTLTYILAIP